MPLSNKSFKDIASWDKKKQRLILIGMLCTAVSLLFSLFFGEMGLIHFSKVTAARRKAQEEIALIERQNNDLLNEMNALKTDPFYIESLARERLGLIKEGEWTYEFYSR
jgi:cell division protein FtsB